MQKGIDVIAKKVAAISQRVAIWIFIYILNKKPYVLMSYIDGPVAI